MKYHEKIENIERAKINEANALVKRNFSYRCQEPNPVPLSSSTLLETIPRLKVRRKYERERETERETEGIAMKVLSEH
jgi:hypothetical protein